MGWVHWGETPVKGADDTVAGAIVDIDGMQFFRVRNYDRMRPFLMSVVSSSNHWMFVSSTGGLTCGRAHPDRALFPYCTDDKVHESASHTGPKTCLLVEKPGRNSLWIPFDDGLSVYEIERNLYKSVYGSRLVFEEVNRDLGLAFSFEWAVGERFGFIRTSRLVNLGSEGVNVRLLDGFIARGVMPNLESLAAEGRSGVLPSPHPYSPRPSPGFRLTSWARRQSRGVCGNVNQSFP